jgi:ribosomal protein S20
LENKTEWRVTIIKRFKNCVNMQEKEKAKEFNDMAVSEIIKRKDIV